jgi:recombinational DNA repair protein (RecF pathway)
LDIITEVQIINSFKKVRKNLKKTSVAYFFVETLGRLTREEEKNEDAFYLILKYFKKLEKYSKLKKLRFDFIFEILVLLGFWPKNKKLNYPDEKLEEVVERKLSSVRVGKKITSI